MKHLPKLYKIIMIAGIMAFGVLLLGYGIGGTYSRYLADDYCYGMVVNEQGFLKAQVYSFTVLMPYSSNRASLTFFSGLAEILGGPRVMPYIPALVILLWAAGSVYTIGQWGKYKARPFSIAERLFIGLGLVFFAFFLAPNRYQILYWRSGMLPYLAPVVINTFAMGWAVSLIRQRSLSLAKGIGLFALLFIAGAFSETASALQAAAWLLAAAWAAIASRRSPSSRGTLHVVLAGLAGTLLGMLVLIASPTNSLSQSRFDSPPDLITLVLTSFRFAFDFIFFSLRGLPVPFAVILGMAFGLAWLYHSSRPGQGEPGRSYSVIRYLILFVVLYLLVAACIAPTVWAMASYPEDRGMLTGRTVLIVAIALAGWWIGEQAYVWLTHRKPSIRTLTTSAVMIGLVLTLFYPLRAVRTVFGENSALRDRAAAWDARDQMIRSARASGQTDLVVPALDSIARIFELQENEGHWVNNCAEQYYTVHTISAVEQ